MQQGQMNHNETFPDDQAAFWRKTMLIILLAYIIMGGVHMVRVLRKDFDDRLRTRYERSVLFSLVMALFLDAYSGTIPTPVQIIISACCEVILFASTMQCMVKDFKYFFYSANETSADSDGSQRKLPLM